jgi:hypothetical protein
VLPSELGTVATEEGGQMRRWRSSSLQDRWWFPTPLRVAAGLGAVAVSLASIGVSLAFQDDPVCVEPLTVLDASRESLPMPEAAAEPVERTPVLDDPLASDAIVPSADYWGIADPHPSRVNYEIPLKWRLVTVGDMLYMLNGQDRLVWKWSTGGPPIIDRPVVDSTGSVHVFALDGISADIDLVTGLQTRRDIMNGSANYRQVIPYGTDSYLVVVDRSGYRDRFPGELDSVRFFRNGRDVSYADLPPGAEVRVQGKRIFSVTRCHGREVVRELSR